MIRLLFDKARLTASLSTLRILPNVLCRSQELKTRTFSTALNTTSPNQAQNLAKDVIVFKYDNPRFFKMMNIFAISQFFFWGYLGHWSFTSLKDAKVPEDKLGDDDLSWWRKVNLGEDKYKNSLAALCFVIGYAVILVGWTFTLRSVRYLIANKNGKDVSLVTYTPFGQNRIIQVPIRCISAQESRQSAKVYLPLKVKGKRLFYILDMKGEFKNTKLFDQSIGLSRKL